MNEFEEEKKTQKTWLVLDEWFVGWLTGELLDSISYKYKLYSWLTSIIFCVMFLCIFL